MSLRIEVRTTYVESAVYVVDGASTEAEALEIIATGELDPISSKIHSEETEVMQCVTLITTEGGST